MTERILEVQEIKRVGHYHQADMQLRLYLSIKPSRWHRFWMWFYFGAVWTGGDDD